MVEFRYRPVAVYPGLLLSALGVALMVGLLRLVDGAYVLKRLGPDARRSANP